MTYFKKILLVDDDTDDQLFFVDAIKELDPSLNCSIANNGVEALGQLKQDPPPPFIIFLDLNMPLMNGFECLVQLRNNYLYKEIPVVIFSTSNHPVDKERTISMGANMFLTKPSDFNTLKVQLQDILTMKFAL